MKDRFFCADYLSHRSISLWRDTYVFLSTSEWTACQVTNLKMNARHGVSLLSNAGPPTMLRCPAGGHSLSRGGFTPLMGFIWLAVASVGRGERFLEGVSTVKTRSASRPKSLTISHQILMMTCGLRSSGRWRMIYSPYARFQWIMIYPSIPQFTSECIRLCRSFLLITNAILVTSRILTHHMQNTRILYRNAKFVGLSLVDIRDC